MRTWQRLLFTCFLPLMFGCSNRVDVCDRYLERYERCFDKMGHEAAAAMKDNLARQRARFDALSKTAAGRAQLTNQCTISLEAIRATCP